MYCDDWLRKYNLYGNPFFLIKIKILQNKYKKNFNGEQAVTKCVLNMADIMSQLCFSYIVFCRHKMSFSVGKYRLVC